MLLTIHGIHWVCGWYATALTLNVGPVRLHKIPGTRLLWRYSVYRWYFPAPGKVSRPGIYSSSGLASQLTGEEGRDFYQSLSTNEWLDIPEPDVGDMCIEFTLGAAGGAPTRWKR